ncbi:hypothetical protein U879_10030 [Defluviimonas sp. 20V17]|uniref:Hpt domain-containing protein n=1 Tax=Allgaiera indica TaxID=765699 RepID=A0AAN4ZYH7_9RHOB|nr:Hpt domain-containing protein [Allgaiera indica]KDB03888.1 hypothetical protein U879_10030 [Defluviimonas sp. 20V17]GHE00070.1 hypothetical protein GCM10008024_10310 [Allgaiera indica]SDW37725.1 Hpt domain-containing protein [Allgaiera indica]
MNMMTMDLAQQRIEEKLRAMRPKFVAQVTDRLARLEDLREVYCALPEDDEVREELVYGAHKLAGVAGMFGAPELGDLARAAEIALAGKAPDALDRLDDLLGEMALIASE